ncbi:DNA mismatch repair protein MutL [Sinobaca qinghaiensis]|uniref:DNA mismatch repair protein MutL n=1 Tax=Sinobaca qinghaiensis TaxID=342944 RepID=A0A419V5W2_9BACL|nr:DNA mismatch repair endonuclease MutL [Sinobaca qinghaiensis]RKD75306.1 DNA mismatch repair protein MutL [Sinobaca qinghaiensis]
MAKITKLPDDLSNKIAAGEVVERPSSVVKELVENAIDAGGTRIQVDLEEGGLSLIRVVDNGSGMDREDADLAFYRHATSKITSEKDLFDIHTLGFRGEALPSIAAVSQLEMETGNGRDAGTLLRYQGGRRITLTSSKSRKGTEISVRDLFFNTPARLKYMKTVHTEVGKVSDIINRLAMSRPDISFRLAHNGKQILHTNGDGRLQTVIASIYGRQTAKSFLPIHHESNDYTVTGYIAKPEINRASRHYMSTFLNERFIRHYPLTKAIEQAYHTLLPIGRHPMAVLHIKLNPTLMDVNVHPSKMEVRLSKEKEMLHDVEHTIKQALQQLSLIPEADMARGRRMQSEALELPLQQEKREIPPKVEESAPPEFRQEQQDWQRAEAVAEPESYTEPSIQEMPAPVEEPPAAEENYRTEPENGAGLYRHRELLELEPIGQLHGTYLLTQSRDGMYIIDQHAAQERIFYEFFREKIGSVNGEMQDLLIPLTFEVTSQEKMVITNSREELEQAGVYLEEFGENTFRIRSQPTWFPVQEAESVIRELLEQLQQEKNISTHKVREEAAILMSCKAAIKANRHLRKDEIAALIEKLGTCRDPYTCPHGRPIVIHFSSYDMEKMFKRIQ